MNLKKTVALLITLAFFACFFAACGKDKPEETSAASETEAESITEIVSDETFVAQNDTTEDESQTEAAVTELNAADLSGDYSSGRCHITVTANGGNELSFVVKWGGSARELRQWEMNGTFDPETGVAEYADCVCADVEFEEDGTETRTVEFENATGSFTFSEGTLTWKENREDIAAGMTFTRDPIA